MSRRRFSAILTQDRALTDGEVEALVRSFGHDGYAREPGVVLASLTQRARDPRPASKHCYRDDDLTSERSS